MHQRKPLVFIILDGWGYTETAAYNAIASANTPQWDQWWSSRPHTFLEASGRDVGLPDGQMGNSEVGHMHIGAGRIVDQDITRINDAISSGEFAHNPIFLRLIEDMKASNKTLHVMGLLSNGGVHSHEDHLFAFLAICHQQNFNHVCLHLFLDGRDTPPESALSALASLNHHLEKHPVARIASVSGRYYAMDRDNRWERIEPVYRLLTEGDSTRYFADAETAIATCYLEGLSDEFIPPTLIGQGEKINDGDALFFFNFRSDRARQLTEAFVNEEFKGFIRNVHPTLSHFVSMTRYGEQIATEWAFSPIHLHQTFGEVIAAHGLSQLRIAETEKYAHVTYFFDGGKEQVFPNEDRILIPSPPVATYDLTPEMSAPALTCFLMDAINNGTYDVIICNYANADMVGHTGHFEATVSAIECLDHCLRDVWRVLAETGGSLVITADHGNAECMFDEATLQAHTAHTCHQVPFLYIGEGWHFNDRNGSLADIAPTLLTLLGIIPPAEMTGHSLLVENHAGNK